MLTDKELIQFIKQSKGLPSSPNQKAAIATIQKADDETLAQILSAKGVDPLVKAYARNRKQHIKNFKTFREFISEEETCKK